MSRNTIPTIFSGCLPSLRYLSLPKTVIWPTGLFRGITSFECGTLNCIPVFPAHVLDVIRGSPLIESIHVVGVEQDVIYQCSLYMYSVANTITRRVGLSLTLSS